MTKLDVIQPNLNTRSVYDFEFEIASLRCVTTINVYNYVTCTTTVPRESRGDLAPVRSVWRGAGCAKFSREVEEVMVEVCAHSPWPSRRGEGEEAEVGLARILQFPPRLLPRSVA